MTRKPGPPRDPLQRARIGAPCPKRWEELDAVPGDPSRRFCGECALHVVDLSALSPRRVRALVRRSRGARVCALLVRDASGRVVTRAPRSWWRRVAATIAAIVPLAILAGCGGSADPDRDSSGPAGEGAATGEAAVTGEASATGAASLDAAADDTATPPQSPSDELSPELLQQLSQLGYLCDDG